MTPAYSKSDLVTKENTFIFSAEVLSSLLNDLDEDSQKKASTLP